MHCALTRYQSMLIGVSLVVLSIGVGTSPASEAERQYQAQWIWGRVESPTPFQFVRFRKTINLASQPTNVTAYVTADTFYRLWINEQLVMHGPARSSRGKATVDPIEVGRYLIQGTNTLMIEVFHGICPLETLAQAPGLLCELEAESNGKREIIASTDDTWQSAEITAWQRDSLRFSYQRGWIEQYDARQNAKEQWHPAIVLGKAGMAPWSKLEMRDVPFPAPLLPVRPTDVVAVARSDGFVGDVAPVARFELPRPEWDRQSMWLRRLQTEGLHADAAAAVNSAGVTTRGGGDTMLQGDGASIAYDFGLSYLGFIGFEVTGHEGQTVEIAWGERLPADAVRPRNSTEFNNALRLTLREGRQCFLGFTPQLIRFLRVVQRGPGNVILHRLGVTEFRFPDEHKGSFRCSDDELNRVYDAARRTAMFNTLDAFIDCPQRERNAMYGVEGYWTERAVFPMFGDTSVSRRSVVYGADSVDDPGPGRVGPPGLVQLAYPMHMNYYGVTIPTQPLFWVLNLGLYERYSGDATFTKDMLSTMRRNLAVFDGWCNADGLLESLPPPIFMFFDWADIRGDGVSIALNSLYAKTLDEAARLERLTGDAGRAENLALHANKVRDAINQLCAGGIYYPDVLFRNEKKELVCSPEASETTQYYAMWCSVPPPDRQQRMWRALREDFVPTPLKKVQPIQGLARAGLYTFLQRLEVAAKLGDHAAVLRDSKAMFLPMADSPCGTLWEDPWAGLAMCHSIGCGVGGILTEEILGIQLGFPLRITPHNDGSLQSCEGYVTTPRGRIEVAWECQPNRYQLRASIPSSVTAEIILPPEAKAVWQLAPATSPWQETVTINANATVVVEPGRLTVN